MKVDTFEFYNTSLCYKWDQQAQVPKGPINSHTDYIRCQFVNVEVVLGANLKRFNLLMLFSLKDWEK